MFLVKPKLDPRSWMSLLVSQPPLYSVSMISDARSVSATRANEEALSKSKVDCDHSELQQQFPFIS